MTSYIQLVGKRGILITSIMTSITISALLPLVACDKDGSGSPDVTVHLQALQSCTDVEASIRQTALKNMNQRLDDILESALQSSGNRCAYRGEMMDDYAGVGNISPAPQASASGAETSGGSATVASGTNNQVAGVDEADFVKNDNKYIYVLSDEALRIIEAWPAEQSKEIAKVAVTGTARKLFVHNDRALVYSSVPHEPTNGSNDEMTTGAMSYPRYNQECTYGYGCQFTGDGNATKITVFDISDRTAPKLMRELYLSGSFVNARRVDSAVYTVLSSPGVQFPGLKYYPDNYYSCDGTELQPWEVIEAFAQLRAANTKIIRETPVTDWLPSARDVVVVGPNKGESDELLTDCNGFYAASIADGSQFTTLLGLHIDNEEPAQASTIVSRPGAVYASAQALYVSVPRQRAAGWGWYPSMEGCEEASTVHKFVLQPKAGTVHYAASGVVKGHVLNQFAMDEHEGYLRIATTSGHVPSPDVLSTVTVLAQQGDSLQQTGKIDGLAPKEDIRSVRFDGNRAFIVTFKKTDPLFVIDLAQPAEPKVLAELKIPGFSTYMHMMDANHLLTIGYDADDQGSFAWFAGVLLQIFDVSNLQAPERIHKEVIGTRGSSSEALTNHLAFTYFAPKHALALPITVCEGSSGGGSYGNTMTFSGLMVYNVTAEEGFQLRGKVAHPTAEGVSCGNWWTNASSQVKRSIFMDDYVYSISHDRIKVNRLDNLATDLRDIPIAD